MTTSLEGHRESKQQYMYLLLSVDAKPFVHACAILLLYDTEELNIWQAVQK
jgi:hypothetical protein